LYFSFLSILYEALGLYKFHLSFLFFILFYFLVELVEFIDDNGEYVEYGMTHKINKQLYSVKQINSSKILKGSTNVILNSISNMQRKFSPFLLNCYGGFKENNDYYLISEYSSNRSLRLFLDECIFESYYIDEMALFLFFINIIYLFSY
jgi:serine/threonine protein kinase